jgi:inorganic pyrophosphatase
MVEIKNIKDITLCEKGAKNTKNFSIFYEHNNELISPWHDIPLQNNDFTYNFICEIPKWTRNKMEISRDLHKNPIKQDIKCDELRVYKYGDMMFNYGAFPKTWEDPKFISKYTNLGGDDDPLDAIEIGIQQLSMGSINKVKVLGILAMIDDGETDWKVIVISKDDYMAHLLNDINDVHEKIPQLLPALRDWLRNYKVIDGDGEHTFELNEKYQNKEFAIEIINECHDAWENKFNLA